MNNSAEALIRNLVSQPTITADLDANQKSLEWCQEYLRSQGISSQIETFAARPVLLWGAPLSQTKILFNTHLDVVPADEDGFKPQVKGGKLFGRGTADTKSSVAIWLNLPPELVEEAAKAGVTFCIVTDEEIGGESSRELIGKLGKQLRFGFFGEPTNLTIQNEAKGIIQIEILTSGVAFHGSKLWQGKNAIISMTKQLESFLTANPIPEKETQETTFNFSKIEGGSAINQVPDSCRLLLDVRFSPKDEPEKVVETLKKYFKDSEIKVLKAESPIFAAKTDPFVEKFSQSIKETQTPVMFTFSHGSADARHCTALGIPAVVFGPTGDNLHAVDEWVDLNSVELAQKIVGNLLKLLTV